MTCWIVGASPDVPNAASHPYQAKLVNCIIKIQSNDINQKIKSPTKIKSTPPSHPHNRAPDRHPQPREQKDTSDAPEFGVCEWRAVLSGGEERVEWVGSCCGVEAEGCVAKVNEMLDRTGR